MSVLIKGMMMPVNCQTCPFVQNEYPIGGEALVYRCRCTFTQKLAGNPAFERNKDCPLVEIPPHGDLIDAQEEMRLMQSSDYDSYDDYRRAFDMLDNAPTIIEAEEEKE